MFQSQGITVDDFPALASLYAGGAQSVRDPQRASSGEIGGGDGSAAEEARAQSLVMKVDCVAVTARLWSLVPWSRVRQYDKVHLKGITLRLRQVNGILNFSFLALRESPGYTSGSDEGTGAGGGVKVGNNSSINGRSSTNRNNSSSVVGGEGSRSGSMEDLDGIVFAEATTDDEGEEEVIHVSTEEEIAIAVGQQEGGLAGGQRQESLRQHHHHHHQLSREQDLMAEEAMDPPSSPRDSVDTNNTFTGGASEGGASSSSTSRLSLLGRGRFSGRSRRIAAPWATGVKGQQSDVETAAAAGRGGGGSGDVDARQVHQKGARSVEDSVSLPKDHLSGGGQSRRVVSVASMSQHRSGPEEIAHGARTPVVTTAGGGGWVFGGGGGAWGVVGEKPGSENRGNLGMVKILGEAFMRRFNAYAEQVRVHHGFLVYIFILHPHDMVDLSFKKLAGLRSALF